MATAPLHVARPWVAPGPGHGQRCLCGRGRWPEHIDAAQPLVLAPDSSIPQEEAHIGPVILCDCSSPPSRAGAEASGGKSGYTRQKRSKGWMKRSAERAMPRSAWLTHSRHPRGRAACTQRWPWGKRIRDPCPGRQSQRPPQPRVEELGPEAPPTRPGSAASARGQAPFPLEKLEGTIFFFYYLGSDLHGEGAPRPPVPGHSQSFPAEERSKTWGSSLIFTGPTL